MTAAPECSPLRRILSPAVLISIVVSLMLLFVFFLEIGRAIPLVQRAAIGALVIGLTAGFTDRWAGFLIGVFLCVLPFFGNQVTNVGVTSVVLACLLRGYGAAEPDVRRWRGDPIHWALVLLFVESALRVLPVLSTEWDPLITRALVRESGIRGLLAYLWQNSVNWHLTALGPAGFMLALLVYRTSRDLFLVGAAPWFLSGLGCGSITAIAVLAGQVSAVTPWIALNRGAFWELTGRYPATFSDPNAFGIMAAMLILFWAIVVRTPIAGLLSGLLVCALLWSGSRTAGIILIGGAIFEAARRIKARKSAQTRGMGGRKHGIASDVLGAGGSSRTFRFGASLVVLGIICFAGVISAPSVNEALQRALPFPSTVRILQTVHWDHSREMLANRFIYARLALAVWAREPLTGVGWGRFIEEQSTAARALGIGLDGWRDNANNFYLHILAEGGLIGILLVGTAFVLFARALLPRSALARSPMPSGPRGDGLGVLFGVFAVALLTGPHLLFDEVRAFFAILLGFASSSRDLGPQDQTTVFADPSSPVLRPLARSRTALVWVMIGATMIHALWMVRAFSEWKGARRIEGVYGRESAAEGPIVWSVDRARFALCPGRAIQMVLRFRAAHPDIGRLPVRVTVLIDGKLGGAGTRTIELTDTAWHEITYDVQKDYLPQDVVTISFDVSRLWSPSSADPRGDARWLGVMIRWPEEICSTSP